MMTVAISTMTNTDTRQGTPGGTPMDQFRTRRERLLQDVGTMKTADFLKAHTVLVDEYFLSGFAQSSIGPKMGIMRNPYALIALGGYGRAEQCVFSDIDLLFLFEHHVPAEAEELVREIVYPLWDMGLEVGHATRSIKETLKLARNDYEVLTALLDGRFICGMSPLYHRLMEQLRSKLLHLKPNKIINWLIDTNRTRHQRFGDSAYLLEPNLKEGKGGLRDYHTMMWIGRILSNIKQARDLEYYGYLSHDEYQTLTKSLRFVWKVRNQLHMLTGRKCDQLHLDTQTKAAEIMRIKATKGHLPVELLLGELHGCMEFIKQCYRVFIYELDQRKRMRRKNKALKETQVPGLKFNRGMLNFVSPEAVLNNPLLLAWIFEESSIHRAPLSAEARRLIRDFSDMISGPAFRSRSDVVAAFEHVLMRPVGEFNALNTMLDTGYLTNFLPVFKGVVNRIQFDQYHLYPVARHLLRTVEMLKAIIADKKRELDPLAHQLYQEIRNKRALFWAALLHDIGKVNPAGGHSERGAVMAEQILGEIGLPPAESSTISFLIKEHLLLFDTGARRDINEEETSLFVARRIGKAEHLKMLYLLSVADAMATGPKAWNEWTASLMRSLFLKTLNAITQGELVSRRAIRNIEEKKERIMTAAADAAQRQRNLTLFEVMSPRYLLYTPSQEIPVHIDLFQKLGDKDFVWQIEKTSDETTRTVTLCAKDRPGLLSKVAGALTLNSINILDVHIFTWRNNIALDIFKVQAPPDPLFEKEHWQRIAGNLKAALEGRLDISARLDLRQNKFKSVRLYTKQRPQKIIIDNESSSFFTIIDVIAWDFPGLLYRITDALFRCHLDIWVAKIATQVDQIVDVFYVRNFDGEKVDRPDDEARIRAAIEEVLQ